VLSQWLTDAGIPFEELLHGTIEGGDVIVHHPFVFVGLSQRTDRAGLSALRDRLDAEWEVVPIPLAPSVLHLDCVFAILGPARMLWCPSLITDGHDRLREIFHERLEVTQEQVLHMAANVLLINPTTVCVEQRQHILKLDLEALGFTVHVVDWRETKKLGGLFRCASAPLQRLA
jgi:N-dimethylarginine dimethylaminohydrolase